MVCPGGDRDTVKVHISILGSDGLPTQHIPAEDMLLIILQDSLYLCSGDTIEAISDGSGHGLNDFSFSDFGGHGQIKITASVMGILSKDTLTVTIKSPDYVPSGYVNLADLSCWATAYPSACGDPNYVPWFDFDSNCIMNLVDFVLFCDHWLHHCQ